MEWFDKELNDHFDKLDKQIFARTCDLCGADLYVGDEVYKLHSENICICEDCFQKEIETERPKNTVCSKCGNPYFKEISENNIEGFDMVHIYDEYYCETCFYHDDLSAECYTEDDYYEE